MYKISGDLLSRLTQTMNKLIDIIDELNDERNIEASGTDELKEAERLLVIMKENYNV